MRDALESIIARLGLATGPDGDLDAAIACAFVFPDLRPAVSGDHGETQFTKGYIRTEHGFLMATQYTSSIDAAIALVEHRLPGWTWTLHSPRSGLKYGAALHDHKTRGGLVRVSEHEGNAALALCLALCRALLAQHGDGDRAMRMTERTRRILAARRQQRDLTANGYRRHETDLEVHRGYAACVGHVVIDAIVSVDGLYVYTKVGPRLDAIETETAHG